MSISRWLEDHHDLIRFVSESRQHLHESIDAKSDNRIPKICWDGELVNSRNPTVKTASR